MTPSRNNNNYNNNGTLSLLLHYNGEIKEQASNWIFPLYQRQQS
jgi:hypothetical protein